MSARETLPRLRIEIDGAPLSDGDAKALAGLRVVQALSLPSLCELTFLAASGPLALAESLMPGAPMQVYVGDAEAPLFSGEVTAVRHGYGPARETEIRVRGYDVMHRLRKRQPVRAHVDVNLAALTRELTADLGIDLDAVGDDAPAWPKLVQWRQSDLELLTELACCNGLYFVLSANRLRFMTLEGDGEALPLELGRTLLEATLDANTDPACRQVEVRGWNPWDAVEHAAQATHARVGRDVGLAPSPDLVGAPGARTLANQTVQTAAQADQMAQAELDRRVAGEVILNAVAAGDERLRPGVRVEISGVAGPFAGRYVLTHVCHTVDRLQGYRCTLDTKPPTVPKQAPTTLTALGKVISVDDPDRLGRVKLTLPNYCDIESDWLQVLVPGAGAGKGLISLPDVGDRVLVLMANDDPAQGVVLGGLYGTERPHDDGVRNGRVRRFSFRTPGGQRICLDDNDNSVRVENRGGHNYLQLSPGRARVGNGHGSYIDMTGKRVRLHANADLEIEAPGKAVVIRGASVDFKEG